MSEHLLLTGAVGLLGRYLLRDLLLAGQPLAVLIRSQGDSPAAARLERVLRHWEAELRHPLARPVCLEGDLTLPDLGLSGEARRWIAGHCAGVLHNAASLTFVGSDRQADPWFTNVGGTSHVLDLCRHEGVRALHYVSTAYVCGQCPGPVFEGDLDHGHEFRNDYERSKFEAEKLVRGASFLERLTVYRPATIVGDSRTGYTSTYHGLYSYLQFVWTLRQYADLEPDGRWHAPIRLNVTGDEPRNLIPVDWVSAVMTRILTQPALHGRTYHLAPPRPVTARELEAAMADVFQFHGPTFVGPEALRHAELNDLEKGFYEYVSRYAPYWAREPVFDCTNTTAAATDLPCPQLDRPLLRRLTEFAIQDQWGKRDAKRAKKVRA
jgi:nucleoside-diphosphate-sugar epimerase